MLFGSSRYAQFRGAGFTAGFVVLLWASSVEAVPMGTDWTAVTATTAVGTLDGISVSVDGLAREGGPDLLISLRDLSAPPYSGAPLAAAEVITYGGGISDWTATFGQAISNLRLYLRLWRGDIGSQSGDVFSYAFDQPFTVLSGLEDAAISGNTITLADTPTPFHQGIIQFTGPISMLTVDVTTAASPFSSDQDFTFGVVPEPSTGVLTLLGFAALCRRGRRA
ncbi:MAG: PEP-CTERM sorting domain-containing protein [Myxococcota bacterium]